MVIAANRTSFLRGNGCLPCDGGLTTKSPGAFSDVAFAFDVFLAAAEGGLLLLSAIAMFKIFSSLTSSPDESSSTTMSDA